MIKRPCGKTIDKSPQVKAGLLIPGFFVRKALGAFNLGGGI